MLEKRRERGKGRERKERREGRRWGGREKEIEAGTAEIFKEIM